MVFIVQQKLNAVLLMNLVHKLAGARGVATRPQDAPHWCTKEAEMHTNNADCLHCVWRLGDLGKGVPPPLELTT